MTDTLQASYLRQQEHGREMQLPACYSAPKSVDHWRHRRMMAVVEPLAAACPDASWLTVGDGAYGSDAHELRQRGCTAVASSLVTDTLCVAQQRGYIDRYLEVNAEAIELPDGAFDFVLCKAAYHHFPRPPVALYEMLRVARIGVVLIEPMEQRRVLDGLRTLVKRALRGDTTVLYETAGNYIYRLSVRELEKLMLALGERSMAYKPFNDFFVPALARGTAEPPSSRLLATKAGIALQNLLCKTGLMGWGLCSTVLFKGLPGRGVTDALAGDGFRVLELPINPYAATPADATT